MREITTADAPSFPDIPLSQGIVTNGLVFVSGQGPIDPKSNEIRGEDVREQTRLTLENVDAILQAADSSIEQAVKVTVYLQDMNEYEEMNAAYNDFFEPPYPARTAIQPADLPADIMVEIDVIAAAR